jgi:hypothetical protein
MSVVSCIGAFIEFNELKRAGSIQPGMKLNPSKKT